MKGPSLNIDFELASDGSGSVLYMDTYENIDPAYRVNELRSLSFLLSI